MVRVKIVQHGEKGPLADDPSLSPVGRAQATVTARWLEANERPQLVWSSPLARAYQTAKAIADVLDVDVVVDGRLVERMNWDGNQPVEVWAHLGASDRSTPPRPYRPSTGYRSSLLGRCSRARPRW